MSGRLALVLVLTGGLALIATDAVGRPSNTRSSTSSVRVGDSTSNAPLGCGKHGDAVSGGFANRDFSRQTSKLFLFGFNPTGRGLPGGPSWRTTVANLGEGTSGRGHLTAFAYCETRSRRLAEKQASVPIGPSAKATATVRCPRGSEAVSGGFSDAFAGTNGSLVFGFRSKRIGSRGWRASAFNMSDSVRSKLFAIVLCDQRQPGLGKRAKEVRLPANGTRSTKVRCGGGREARSAGFASRVRLPEGEGAFPYALKRVRRTGWQASAFAEGPSTAFTAYVYCAKPR